MQHSFLILFLAAYILIIIIIFVSQSIKLENFIGSNRRQHIVVSPRRQQRAVVSPRRAVVSPRPIRYVNYYPLQQQYNDMTCVCNPDNKVVRHSCGNYIPTCDKVNNCVCIPPSL